MYMYIYIYIYIYIYNISLGNKSAFFVSYVKEKPVRFFDFIQKAENP